MYLNAAARVLHGQLTSLKSAVLSESGFQRSMRNLPGQIFHFYVILKMEFKQVNHLKSI